MAGNSKEECLFVWDEASGLYFHARSGFYHDPTAGWYYSSIDGHYYKYESGNYMLLDANMVGECGAGGRSHHEIPCTDDLSAHSDRKYEDILAVKDNLRDCWKERIVPNETNSGSDHTTSQTSGYPMPPPSDWLEDTLIELYLSGYSNPGVDCHGNQITCTEAYEENYGTYELEEGEWIPDEQVDVSDHVVNPETVEAGVLPDEDNWHSQYGQVTRLGKDSMLDVPVTDLWEWTLVSDKDDQVNRLVGRLAKPSAKPHPSISGGGSYFKTAPICQVREDLIRVKTGKIYRLRSPSAKYLASVKFYDSSNPTKDWGFPELSTIQGCEQKSKSVCKNYLENTKVESDVLSASQKDINQLYRDRAAERRVLHRGFGIGPGQKKVVIPGGEVLSSHGSGSGEEAASEVLNATFGEGSYGRKVLKSMGWQEGEGLGSTVKGIVQPLKAIGNVGNAGLGWPKGRKEHH